MDDNDIEKPRVLIVEDEFLIALDLKVMTRALGCDVCGVAANATQAREIAVRTAPDVVLMDVYLEGGREGIEAARCLRELYGPAIVFVTAFAEDGTSDRIQE